MTYTDGTHLVSDNLSELHNFAKRIGLKRQWFQNHKTHPHYDIWGGMVKNVLDNGAVIVTSKEILLLSKKLVSNYDLQ